MLPPHALPASANPCTSLSEVHNLPTWAIQAMEIMAGAEATPVGVVVALDRQEVTGAENAGRMSAIQSVEKEFPIQAVSIVQLKHIIAYLKQKGDQDEALAACESYRSEYGVEY